MYAYKNIGRRRPEGWAERRRYFRRLFETARKENDRKPRPDAAGEKPRG